MPKTIRMFAAAAFIVAGVGFAPIVHAQKNTPDFGDDASEWANDGECDDSRFTGEGMTSTVLLDEDVGHDAADCRDGWITGDITLLTGNAKPARYTPAFGDDDGDFANDDECDDPRFGGRGMTDADLLEDDVLHDAADCREAWNNGELRLVGISVSGAPRFGDDEGDYADDGECDDMRFKGDGMSAGPLLSDDIMHDAFDCKAAWDDGEIDLR